jgi:uncharacterized protein (TIGR02246 family)
MLRSLVFIPVLAIGLALPVVAQQTSPSAGQQDVYQQIVEWDKKYDQAFNKHDATAIAALFSQNAVILPPGPMLSGTQAIEKAYQDAFKNTNFNSDHLGKIVQVQALGTDAAWVVGEWSVSAQGTNNARQNLHGNWGAVAERENGQWTVRMATWNMIEPPPAEATGSTTPSK